MGAIFPLCNHIETVYSKTMLPLTTTQAKDLYLKALVGNNYSDRTVCAYLKDVEQFLEFVKSCRVDWDNPLHFSRVDIVEFFNALAAKGISGVSRARKLAAVRSFFTVLRENTIIAGNPAETVKRAKKEEKEPAVLFRNEYKALLFEARGDVRDFAILVTFLETGIRVGELVSLRVDDVDLANKTMLVRQGKGKKDRSIPLTDQTIKALQDYLTIRATLDIVDKDIVFIAKNGTSMDVRTVRHLVKKYVKDAGIKKQVSVHTMRHTYGSHKVANGMSIPALQELMGHKRNETTYKYVHLANTNLRAEQEKSTLL